MVKKEDVRMILESARMDWQSVSEKDVAFAVLCDSLEDKSLAYRLAYNKSEKDAERFYNTPRFKKLLVLLEPFGVGVVTNKTITREENKAELLKMLTQIEDSFNAGDLEAKDALKMKADIRVKLNDKFEMEESQKQRRIIVVPSKHDIVCPNTNRECNYWPAKKACCTHYGLIDPSENNEDFDNEQVTNHSNE